MYFFNFSKIVLSSIFFFSLLNGCFCVPFKIKINFVSTVLGEINNSFIVKILCFRENSQHLSIEADNNVVNANDEYEYSLHELCDPTKAIQIYASKLELDENSNDMIPVHGKINSSYERRPWIEFHPNADNNVTNEVTYTVLEDGHRLEHGGEVGRTIPTNSQLEAKKVRKRGEGSGRKRDGGNGDGPPGRGRSRARRDPALRGRRGQVRGN
ncbi:hypothetical protein ACQ4LE_002063 [Meloidogyne hapla]